MKTTQPDTKTVRGLQAEEVLTIARQIVKRSPVGILARCDPSGYHRVLWAGLAHIAADHTVRADEPLEISHFLDITDVLWAFTAEDGAAVRVYGKLSLRLEPPAPLPADRLTAISRSTVEPAPDRRQWPLALVTQALAVRVDVPGHGISIFGVLPSASPATDAATPSPWLFRRG